jgi:hypothetical protein
MMGDMEGRRNSAARAIAGAIAAGGSPEALLLVGWAFEIEHPFIMLLFFSPGWFAYFALILAACGKKLPGDPFTTWLPCILVNGFWLLMLGVDTDWTTENKAISYWLVRAYVFAAVAGGVAGLIIELRRPEKTTES